MLAIGNGESRKNINLDLIHQEKVGCNAIFRDWHVEHLVCCDKRLVKQSLKYHPNIYTRHRWASDFSVHSLPELITQGNDRKDEPIHWGSGPYAILLASTLSTNIKLLGFDLYGKKGKVNNLYNNTDGYSKQDSNEVDPSYWIYQIAKVFEWFPKSTFTVYNTADWKLPKEWNLGNVSLDIIDNL